MIKLQTTQEAASAIQKNGAILVRNVLNEHSLNWYLSRAKVLRYEEQPREFGKRQVRQDVWSAPVVSGTALDTLATSLENAIVELVGEQCFDEPLWFNHRNIQRYEHGSHGIDPHKDHHHFFNLIALFGLAGEGTFTIYSELGGRALIRLVIAPNTLLLMKAPGFCGEQICPWHGVGNIKGGDDGQRYLLGLRQNNGGE